MNDVILVYVTCENTDQAKEIASQLIKEKLVACANIFPEMIPMLFWPPKSETLVEGKEVVLILKTLSSLYQSIEQRVEQLHTYQVPCIMSIPVTKINANYHKWIVEELE